MTSLIKLFTTSACIFFTIYMSAQNTGIAINTDNADPDPSAILDVKSTSKGMLVPRMTTAQREAISNAAVGLLVFDLTEESFFFKGAAGWMDLSGNQNNAYAFPDTAGVQGQVLQADATGNPVWTNTTQSSGLPAGTILAFGGSVAPDGFLECDGSPQNPLLYPDLYAAIQTNWGGTPGVVFNLPDLRGQFLRGWNHGSGNDPDAAARQDSTYSVVKGDVVGSYQNHEFRSHNHGGGDHSHSLPAIWHAAVGGFKDLNNTSGEAEDTSLPSSGIIIATEGGSETRPKNAYVMYIIKY